MSTERPIPYNLELFVVTAWNGAGTPLVFSSKENCERALNLYESLNKEANLPWTYDRAAVNGDRILDLFINGLRPWKITLGADLALLSCRLIPIHHITLKLVLERYEGGAPRVLEVWAADRDAALVHTKSMLTTDDKVKLLYDLDTEWSFAAWIDEQKLKTAGWGAAESTPAATLGLEDEVDFFSDEQKKKMEEAKTREMGPLAPAPRPTAPLPPTPSYIVGFGNVLKLTEL